MLNFSKLPATPGLARRLLAFSRLNGLTFDENVAQLAMEGLLDQAEFDHFPFALNQYEYAAIQHVLDWNGRAMLLDSGADRLRTVALASLWARSPGQTLIIVRPHYYAQWAQLVREVWPTATISVFGNQRHLSKDEPLPAGIAFSERPDISADFLITSYSGMVWNEIHFLDSLKYTIVEELSDLSQVNYKWEESVLGAFKELPAPLFLQDLNMLPKDKGVNLISSLSVPSSNAVQRICETASHYMFGGNRLPLNITDERNNKTLTSYLSMRGYSGHSVLELLTCIGISSELLKDGLITNDVVSFYDQTVLDVKAHTVSAESGVGRMLLREKQIQQATGRSMAQVAQDALGGATPSQELLRDLMNNSWAAIKSNHIKKIVDDLFSFLSRTIILTDNPELICILRLQFGKSAEHLSSLDDPEVVKRRFIDRNMIAGVHGRSKPLRILIASIADLEDTRLLNAANHLIMADTPLDREDYTDIKYLSDEFGIRLVLSVLRGTFEDQIHTHLTKS